MPPTSTHFVTPKLIARLRAHGPSNNSARLGALRGSRPAPAHGTFARGVLTLGQGCPEATH